MKKTDLAYMAGLFDGEGCIHIAKLHRPESKIDHHYGLVATVGMTSEFLVKLYQFRFGGSVYHYKVTRERRKPEWQWTIRSRQAAEFLRVIKPYLILKLSETELALKFQESKKLGSGKTDEQWAIEEAQYILMKNLKDKSGVKYGEM